MAKTVEHIHWPNAPDMWMPYAPAIKVRGGTTVYLAGVTAAPVYHHHPHRPEEFDAMPKTMEGQARAALENLKRGLEAVGATFNDVVTADRFCTDLTDQDALNKVWAEYFRDAKPATTTVQVVRLATDPRCLIEINAVAVVDQQGRYCSAARRKRARKLIQISAMTTPGMVLLSCLTRCTSGRSPVASKASRAASFCSNFARQARRINCQCSNAPTGIASSA